MNNWLLCPFTVCTYESNTFNFYLMDSVFNNGTSYLNPPTFFLSFFLGGDILILLLLICFQTALYRDPPE